MFFNPAPGNGSRGFLFSAAIDRPALNTVIGVVPGGAFASRSMQGRSWSEGRPSFRDSLGMQIFYTFLRETPSQPRVLQGTDARAGSGVRERDQWSGGSKFDRGVPLRSLL